MCVCGGGGGSEDGVERDTSESAYWSRFLALESMAISSGSIHANAVDLS